MKRPPHAWARAALRDAFDAIACALYDAAAWVDEKYANALNDPEED